MNISPFTGKLPYFFMQVRHASRLVKLTVFAGFVWLVILFGITLTDYFSRGFLG